MHAIAKYALEKYRSYMHLIFLFACGFTSYTQCRHDVLMTQDELLSLIQEPARDETYRNAATPEELESLRTIHPRKAVTLVIYIAADNDLHPFAWKNIKQMEAIGSNENINIIVQLNTPGYFTPTKRYLIKNGKRLLIPAQGEQLTQKLNSGSPQTLIDCVAWAMEHYPADHLYLNLWDHGAGVYDPGVALDYYLESTKIVSPLKLFNFNENTRELELDRSLGYTIDPEELESIYPQPKRAICFDETFKSFLSNQDLKFAFSEIQRKVLQGKKIDVIWFDACLMSMVEIANLCKDHVAYLVGSEEVEYSSGSNYELVLAPFAHKALNPLEFACHVVNSYERAYQQITRDYTQSAIDLTLMQQLENNINQVAGQLLMALNLPQSNAMLKFIQQSKSRANCICFQEPSYIDLRNFYANLQNNIHQTPLDAATKYNLLKLLDQGIHIINAAVVANKAGSNLAKAGGISIYFPETGIFQSYPKCQFAQSNNWSKFISQYLILKRKMPN